jgi:hypothetical protein
MPGMGASGALVMVQIKPNRMAMRMTLPGLGDIRSGFDGEVGWSINPMEGPRAMSGAELVQVKDEADFGAATRDARLLASAETVGREEFDGRACWKVKLGWRSGRESFDCYDVESGLLIATVQQNATGMGPVESVTIFSDYRDFDGIRMPAVTTQKAFNQQLVFTIEKVTWGSVDPAEVALPDAIVALLGRK